MTVMRIHLQNAGRIIGVVVISCMLVLGLCSCEYIVDFLKSLEPEQKTDEQLIEERIDEFATAYNNGDYDGVLECLDTKTRNTYNAMMNVGGALLGGFGLDMGISLSDLFSLGVGFIAVDEVMAFDIHSIEVGDNGTAVVDVTIKSAVGGFSEKAYFTMKKEKDDWFIRNLQTKNN